MDGLGFGGETFDPDDVDVLPSREPTTIVCVGLDYAKHADRPEDSCRSVAHYTLRSEGRCGVSSATTCHYQINHPATRFRPPLRFRRRLDGGATADSRRHKKETTNRGDPIQ